MSKAPRLKQSANRLWIDLGGLSGLGEDLGVGEFLNNVGFIPSAVSVLSSCPDLIHEHDGRVDDTALRWEYSSYNGWKRTRRWTREELRRAAQEFRKRGTKVFLSCMAYAYHPAFEKFSDWAKEHSELFLVHATGLHAFAREGLFADMRCYHIAARFKDGGYYEDFFADQVRRVVVDYGFDGFHAADGYKSFVLGIMAAGFSRDMLEQFEEYSGIELPEYRAGELTEVIPPVAEWIWKNKREEWIGFWRQRLARSWHKTALALKSAEKEFSINSPWCTDPLESITRYGMDSKALEEASAESVFFETMDIYTLIGPMSGPESTRREGYILEGHEFYPGSLTAALVRAVHTPGVKLYPMIHVHDQFERFEFLKSGRSYLERAIIGYRQLYRILAGKLEPATDGVWYAVPNDLSAEDWKFLRTSDELATSIRPAEIPGPIALWSASTVENEIGLSRDRWSVHRSLHEIVGAGCPIITGAQVDEIDSIRDQVLIWVNPKSFSDDEQERVWANASEGNRLIIFDSNGKFEVPLGITAIEIIDGLSGAKLAITGTTEQIDAVRRWLPAEGELMKSRDLLNSIKLEGDRATLTASEKPQPFEYRDEMEAHFMTRVPPTRLATPYLELTAEISRRISWPLISEIRVHVGPRAGESAGHENNLFYITDKQGDIYLFAENFHRHASYLKVTWAKPVLESEQLNSVLFHPAPHDREIEIVIPAWGITVYKIAL